jgi:hypothetical protein
MIKHLLSTSPIGVSRAAKTSMSLAGRCRYPLIPRGVPRQPFACFDARCPVDVTSMSVTEATAQQSTEEYLGLPTRFIFTCQTCTCSTTRLLCPLLACVSRGSSNVFDRTRLRRSVTCRRTQVVKGHSARNLHYGSLRREPVHPQDPLFCDKSMNWCVESLGLSVDTGLLQEISPDALFIALDIPLGAKICPCQYKSVVNCIMVG